MGHGEPRTLPPCGQRPARAAPAGPPSAAADAPGGRARPWTKPAGRATRPTEPGATTSTTSAPCCQWRRGPESPAARHDLPRRRRARRRHRWGHGRRAARGGGAGNRRPSPPQLGGVAPRAVDRSAPVVAWSGRSAQPRRRALRGSTTRSAHPWSGSGRRARRVTPHRLRHLLIHAQHHDAAVKPACSGDYPSGSSKTISRPVSPLAKVA